MNFKKKILSPIICLLAVFSLLFVNNISAEASATDLSPIDIGNFWSEMYDSPLVTPTDIYDTATENTIRGSFDNVFASFCQRCLKNPSSGQLLSAEIGPISTTLAQDSLNPAYQSMVNKLLNNLANSGLDSSLYCQYVASVEYTAMNSFGGYNRSRVYFIFGFDTANVYYLTATDDELITSVVPCIVFADLYHTGNPVITY